MPADAIASTHPCSLRLPNLKRGMLKLERDSGMEIRRIETQYSVLPEHQGRTQSLTHRNPSSNSPYCCNDIRYQEIASPKLASLILNGVDTDKLVVFSNYYYAA
jgi:hypothetical protein